MRRYKNILMHKNTNFITPIIIFFIVFFHQPLSAADKIATLHDAQVWLETLSAQEQRTAIVLFQLALARKFGDVIATSNSNDNVTARSGSKMFACGHSFAARLATKNKDQREALLAITKALTNVILAKGSPVDRAKSMREAEIMGENIASSISDRLFYEVTGKYSIELERLNAVLINDAMECASGVSQVNRKP